MDKSTSPFNEDFTKSYNEKNDQGYFIEVDVRYLEKLHELHNYLSFLLEWMNIEKAENLTGNLLNQTENLILIRNLKKALNYGLVFKKVHRMIKFNQNAWLKPYNDMNTDLKKKARNDFEKDFFKVNK